MPFVLPVKHRLKGHKAEMAFRAWLNASAVAYMYVEQSRFTVPLALKGRIKRPDYLVGLPQIGLLAFEVKAKAVYDGRLIFERDEVEKLALFARMFHVTLYFVCVDDQEAGVHRWVPVSDLARRPLELRNRRSVVTYPAAEAVKVDLAQPFLAVLFQLVKSALSS